MSGTEPPCEVDGKPCDWVVEDGCEELEIGWDMYCSRCGRWRDWTKDEMAEAAK